MRLNRRARRGAVAGALVLTGSVWSGCNGKTATEYVAGISSQVQVPRDLLSVVITVDVGGVPAFSQAYPVYDSKIRLPRTLGVVKNSTPAGIPVTITVAGFTVQYDDPSYSAISSSDPPMVGGSPSTGGGARILRRFRQPYAEGRIVYTPMPLHFACYDVDCSTSGVVGCADGKCTCKGGVCVVPDVDASTLPDYDDSLIYGSTNTCFRPFTSTDSGGSKLPGCMDYGIPPLTVDAGSCIYSLPNTPSAPADAGPYDPTVPTGLVKLADAGGGLNVRAVFDNYVSEVLDYEGQCPAADGTGAAPVEGYCTFKGEPQRFQLAAGLCSSPFHKITLLEASATCPSKTQFQPICDDAEGVPWQPTLLDGGSSSDGSCGVAKPLTPAKSALYMLWDNSSGMRDFFGQDALSQVLNLSLGDPVFQQTQVAFSYTPGPASDCTAVAGGNSFESPRFDFKQANLAQVDIANSLFNEGDGGLHAPGTDPWYLEAALEGSYTKLLAKQASEVEAYNRTAVMLFLDRDFRSSPTDCATTGNDPTHLTALQEAQKAFAAGIETYVVYLANADFDAGNAGPQALSDATSLALGFNPNLKYFFNASAGAAANEVAAEALADVTADLGSCVYEVPGGVGPGAVLQFPDPISRSLLQVKNDTSCTNDDPASSPTWVFDNQHIRVCQNTCQRIIAAIQADQASTAQHNAATGSTASAAGVTVYATEACDAPAGGEIVESGTAPSNFDAGTVGSGTEDSGATGAPSDAAVVTD